MRADTKIVLERKLGVGEGQALAMAIDGGFKVGDRLEHKLGVLFGSDTAAWNFCTAIQSPQELSQPTKNAIVAAFGGIHGAELIRAVEPQFYKASADLVTEYEADAELATGPTVTFTPNEQA